MLGGGRLPNARPGAPATPVNSQARTSSRMIQIKYSNITKWGPTAETYASKSNSDMLVFVEHHLDKFTWGPVKPKILTWNRKPYLSFARRRGLHSASTSGGQMLLPKSHLDTSAVPEAVLRQCIPRDQFAAPRWTACNIRTKNQTIMVVSVYLRSGEGLSEANLTILHQLALLVSFVKGEVILVGDWQTTPDTLQTHTLVAKLGLRTVVAPNVDATCTAGQGRVIDFAVATPGIAQYLSVQADLAVPWKSHIGLTLSFPARLRAYQAPALRVPRVLPELPLQDDGQHVFQQQVWQRASIKASEFVQGKSCGSGLPGATVQMVQSMDHDQRSLSLDLCMHSYTTEFYALLLSDVPPAQYSLYVGRGAIPHCKLMPIVPRHAAASRMSCGACDLWDTVSTLLVWIMRYAENRLCPVNTKRAIVDLKKLCLKVSSNTWSSQAAPNAPIHAWRSFMEGLSFNALEADRPGYTVERIKTWQTRADAQLKVAVAARKIKLRKKFRGWLDADLRNGAAGAHKLVKECGNHDLDNATKEAPLQDTFNVWQDLWGASRVEARPLRSDNIISEWIPWRQQVSALFFSTAATGDQQRMLHDFRQALFASQHHLQVKAFTGTDLQAAVKSYPTKKAAGVDHWNTAFFRKLPICILDGFALVVDTAQKVLQWPTQMLLNLMSLIQKPSGGERSVAKTPFLYRMWNVFSTPTLKEWSKQTAKPWDFATAGRSALQSAAHRAWANEVAAFSGKEIAALLWDIEKFFDSISPQQVLEEGINMAYPATELLLGLSMHLAPRCLGLGKITSNVIFPTKSILAGCSHSKNFARMVMDPSIAKVASVRAPPALRVSTFVDDVAQIAIGTLQQVSNDSTFAAMKFCSAMKAINLKISSKSVIVSSSPRIAANIAALIKKHSKVMVQVHAAARDLGVLNNPSRRRRTDMQASRITKAGNRLCKIAPLARAVRRARNLTHTGAIPQALWGVEVLGLAPTPMGKLITKVASSSGIWATGRCATTAIFIAFGPARHPAVAGLCQQVELWLQLRADDPSLRASSVRYWSDVVNRVLRPPDQASASDDHISAGFVHWCPQSKESKWNSVFGPMGSLICSMHDFGWSLRSSGLWTDPDGRQWIPDVSQKLQPFVQLVRDHAIKGLWRKASQHWAGEGLQAGVDWAASMALHWHLSKMLGNVYDDADADFEPQQIEQDDPLHDGVQWSPSSITWLELFMSGGYWPQQRAAEAHPVTPMCPRCGLKTYETALHLIWHCPANAQISDERVVDSQHLISHADQGVQQHPCLWLRGLLPSDLVAINTPVVTQCELTFYGQVVPHTGWEPGHFYTDCSGGPFSSFPPIRRAGFGIAVIREDDHLYRAEQWDVFLWGAYGPVPGLSQTVPRGELYAILAVVERVKPGETTVSTDSLVNVHSYHKGRQACMQAENSDLWCQIFSLLDSRGIVLTLKWVKGHADDVDTFLKYSVTPQDLIGNMFADMLADCAADRYQVFPQDALSLRWHYATIRLIQARAVCILSTVMEARVPHVPVSNRQGSEQPLTIGASILRSQHRFVSMGRVLHCSKCLQHSPADVNGKRRWLSSPCVVDKLAVLSVTMGSTKPASVPSGRVVRVGHATLHFSHLLVVYRGLFYCSKCGYTASAKAQKLVARCDEVTHEGIQRVLRLKAGKLPSGLKSWPNDQPHKQDACIELEQ